MPENGARLKPAAGDASPDLASLSRSGWCALEDSSLSGVPTRNDRCTCGQQAPAGEGGLVKLLCAARECRF